MAYQLIGMAYQFLYLALWLCLWNGVTMAIDPFTYTISIPSIYVKHATVTMDSYMTGTFLPNIYVLQMGISFWESALASRTIFDINITSDISSISLSICHYDDTINVSFCLTPGMPYSILWFFDNGSTSTASFVVPDLLEYAISPPVVNSTSTTSLNLTFELDQYIKLGYKYSKISVYIDSYGGNAEFSLFNTVSVIIGSGAVRPALFHFANSSAVFIINSLPVFTSCRIIVASFFGGERYVVQVNISHII